jgi:hypothetical protein
MSSKVPSSKIGGHQPLTEECPLSGADHFRSCSRSEPCSLPQGKRKKPHIEVSGRSHTESPVERVNAVSDPEGHASDDEHDCCSWNKSHLSGGCVHAECCSRDKEQNELLHGVVDDAAIDLHRQVLLLQRWIDSLVEKARISHHQNAEQ